MKQADIEKHITTFLTELAFPASDLSVEVEPSGDFWVSATIENPRLLIGTGTNEVFLAINHLFNKLLEKHSTDLENPIRVTVDINGFQKKRVENLKTVAHMMAERARFFKSSVELDPMSAYERRIIHEFLGNTKDIKTESTGEGRDRRVIIRFVANDDGIMN